MNSFLRRTARCLVALVLGVAIICGLFGEYDASALNIPGVGSSSDVKIFQVEGPEKPNVWIETSIVLDSNKKPTGYIEIALKAQTKELFFADANLEKLRYPGDGLDTNATSPYKTALPFDPDDPTTYPGGTRHTTFKELGVVLSYDDELMIPVSWDHKIGEIDPATNKPKNAYPDFFADYYVDNVETKTAQDIMTEFRAAKNIPIPTLPYNMNVSTAQAYHEGQGLMSLSITAAQDTSLPEETVLAVVRFLYLGDAPLESLLVATPATESGFMPNHLLVLSGHDYVTQATGSNAKNFIWFADETDISSVSRIQQALIYRSGRYQEDIKTTGSSVRGVTEFYATKVEYNGAEVALPGHITAADASNAATWKYEEIDCPVDGCTDDDGKKIHRPLTDEDNTDVLAAARRTDALNKHSYTTNLLFTSNSYNSFEASTNVCFSLRAGETYRSTGNGGSVKDFCALVFYDWDNTALGALVAPKGDARATVEAYVENFIHPSLRKSTAVAEYEAAKLSGDATAESNALARLRNLATSLDRQYTYAGSHVSDYSLINGAANYRTTEAGLAQSQAGNMIYPDGYIDNGEDMAGSSYPLTNKLDYAFWRRPWKIAHTYDPVADAATYPVAPYTNSKGEGIAATEWSTGVVDYTGEITGEDDWDDYWYTNGWAVIADPGNMKDVWTTFSTYGELASVRLPGYDSTTVAPGGSRYNAPAYLNIDYIRACEDRPATDPAGLVTVPLAANIVQSKLAGTGVTEEIAFATYGETAYFEFANFADLDADSLFIKACYEPSEQLNWTGNYTVVSEPYYVRYGEVASTATSGSVYGISFDYERVDTSGHGVRRIRDPWTSIQYTIDQNMTGNVISVQPGQVAVPVLTGNSFFVGAQLDSTDILNAAFTPTSCFISMTYGVVEVYDCANFVASISRSIQENEAEVVGNFNYMHTTVSGDTVGFSYDERLGSDGFIFRATWRQILEQATKNFNDLGDDWKDTTNGNWINTYLTTDTMMDLNLRITGDGMIPELSDDATLDEYNTWNANYSKARYAIYDALKTAYYYQVKQGGADCIDLDWHQVQYHIINWIQPVMDADNNMTMSNSGIDKGSNAGIYSKEDCLQRGGGFEWCRLDECGADISIPMASLQHLFEAVQIYNTTDTAVVSPAKKEAARVAIKDKAPDLLTDLKIFKTDKDGSSNDLTTINALRTSGKYDKTDADAQEVINAITALMARLTADGVDYKALSAGNIQRWLMTYKENSATAEYAFNISDPDHLAKYWWMKWDTKPAAVDFSSVTPSTAADLLINVVYQAVQQSNPMAWDGLTDVATINGTSTDTSRGMRFRKNTQGDFFDETTQTGFTSSSLYTTMGYTTDEIEGDWASRARVLEAYDSTDLDSFKSAITTLITTLGNASAAGSNWTASDISLTWEQIQYYLLHNTTADHPEYYSGTENGQYWWKENNTRFNKIAQTAYTTGEDPDKVQHNFARPTNAIFDDGVYYNWNNPAPGQTIDLIDRLNAVRQNVAGAEEKLRIWFTTETATDLVFKANDRGTNPASSYLTPMVNKLIELAKLEPSNGNFVTNLVWSQIQYYLINGTYISQKGAQSFTHDESKCSWSINAWRDEMAPSISSLKVLIDTIEVASGQADPVNYLARQGVASFDDLTIPELYFKISAVTGMDVGHTPMNMNLTVRNSGIQALFTLRTLFNDNSTNIKWEDLSSDSNLDDAWYLIQYYLFNGSITGSATTVLSETSEAAKLLYWWKDNWEGYEELSQLYEIACKKEIARLDWLNENGASSQAMTRATTANWSSTAHGTTNWHDIIYAIKMIGDPLNIDMGVGNNMKMIDQEEWWKWVQFLIYHKDNTNISVNAADALALAEHDAFYWWYNGGTANRKVVAMPSVANSVIEYSDTERATAVAAILKNELLWLATGNNNARALVTAQNISRMNIRIKDDEIKKRVELTAYSDTQVADAIEALTKRIYYDNVKTLSDWNYITNYPTGSGDIVFTYNEAAYNALGALSVYDIQHWFETYFDSTPGNESYDGTGMEDTYWWIADEELVEAGGPNLEELREMYMHIFTYAYTQQTIAKLKQDWADTHSGQDFEELWDVTYSYGNYNGVEKGKLATIYPSKLTKARATTFMGKGVYNWAQMYELNKSALVSVKDAAKTTTTPPQPSLEGVFYITTAEFNSYMTSMGLTFTPLSVMIISTDVIELNGELTEPDVEFTEIEDEEMPEAELPDIDDELLPTEDEKEKQQDDQATPEIGDELQGSSENEQIGTSEDDIEDVDAEDIGSELSDSEQAEDETQEPELEYERPPVIEDFGVPMLDLEAESETAEDEYVDSSEPDDVTEPQMPEEEITTPDESVEQSESIDEGLHEAENYVIIVPVLNQEIISGGTTR